LLLAACNASSVAEPEYGLQREVELQGTIQALQTELESAQSAPLREPYPFEGLWVTETDDLTTTGQILVITDKHFYQVTTFTPNGSDVPTNLMEMFAILESVDQEAKHMDLRIQWFRNNGQFGGFDYPVANVVYEVSGDSLRIAIQRTGDGVYPEQPDPLPYYRQ
jgi:hypothetical protein